MEPKTAPSSYISPQEYISKEEGKYPSPLGYHDVSIYAPIAKFEVTNESNDSIKLRVLTEKLDRGWFLVFKCFLFVAACTEGLIMVGDLIYLVYSSFAHIFLHLIVLALLAYEARQLYTLLKALHYKDLQLAIKAVRLLGVLMFMNAIGIIGFVPLMVSQMEPETKEKFTMWAQIGIIVGAIVVRELTVYCSFLYGARKVRERLNEIRQLQGREIASTGRY